MMNPYSLSVLDPWSGAGVKIPDECTQLTTTWQSRTRVILTCGSGSNSFLAFSPQVPSGAYSGVDITGFTVPVNYKHTQALANYTTAAQVYQKVRLVSAGVKLVCMQSAATNEGVLYSGLWPRGVSYPGGAQFQASELTAINRFSDGAVVTFRPLDNRDREFFPIDSYPNDDQDPSSTTGSSFLFLISGYAASAKFMIDFVCNYEAVLKPGYTGIVDAEPSPVDPVIMTAAEKLAEAIPPTSQAKVYEETIQSGTAPMEQLAAALTPDSVRLYDQLKVGKQAGGSGLPYYLSQGKKWATAAANLASIAAIAAPVLRRGFSEMKTPYY